MSYVEAAKPGQTEWAKAFVSGLATASLDAQKEKMKLSGNTILITGGGSGIGRSSPKSLPRHRASRLSFWMCRMPQASRQATIPVDDAELDWHPMLSQCRTSRFSASRLERSPLL